jgi:ribosomal protein L31E
MSEIQHYIDRKFGRDKVVFEHELLKDISQDANEKKKIFGWQN